MFSNTLVLHTNYCLDYHCDYTFGALNIKDTLITIIGRDYRASNSSVSGIFYQEWWSIMEHDTVGSLH